MGLSARLFRLAGPDSGGASSSGETWTRTMIDRMGTATGFGNPTVSLGINESQRLGMEPWSSSRADRHHERSHLRAPRHRRNLATVLWESTDSGLTSPARRYSRHRIRSPCRRLAPTPPAVSVSRGLRRTRSTAPPFAPPTVAERDRFGYIDRDGNLSTPVTLGAAWWNNYRPTDGFDWRRGGLDPKPVPLQRIQ
jgi:hypothetical protein